MATKNSLLSSIIILLMLLVIPTAGHTVSDVFDYTFSDGRILSLRYSFSGEDIELEQKTESQAYYKGWIEKGGTFTASATISGSDGYAIRMGCKFYDKHRRKIDEKYDGGSNNYSCSFTMPEDAVEAECYIESVGCLAEIHYRVISESTSTIIDDDDGDGDGDDEEEEDEDDEDDEEGDDYEEDNDAEEEAGIKDYIIPISVGVLLLGGGAVVANNQRKKKKKDKKKDKKKKDDEDNQSDQLEMRLHKAFGDTLIQGGNSEYVYACIIRHPTNGAKYVDNELTSRIQISAGDQYMAVEEKGVVNGWKSAIVQAPENQEPPEEGIVKFRLASAEASYTNNIHFRIMKSGILFAQENLTLPARYEKEVRLPFVAVGMNDGSAKVKITITEEKGGAETKDYSVKVEWNATNKVYEAVIKDLCQNEKDDEGVPGNFIGYKINIEATNDKKRTVKGDLPLYRYYMGLVLNINPEVHCYLEEHNPMRHELVQTPIIRNGKEYVPAENKCLLKLYDWDEEKHAIYVIDPEPVDLKFTLKELDEIGGIQGAYQDIFSSSHMQAGLEMALPGMIGMAGISDLVVDAHNTVISERQAQQQKHIEQQKMIEGLGLSLQARWNSAGEGHMYYILSCRKGMLKAPNRFNTVVEVTALHNGQTYTYKRVVQLMSQPRRSKSDPSYDYALKRDKEIMEELFKIEKAIQLAGLSIRLAPLVAFIDLQHDYYKADFGYDEENFNNICKTYAAVMDREAQEANEAAKEPEGLFNITMDWIMRIDRNLHDMQSTMHDVVLVDKVPLLGWSIRLDVVWRVSFGLGTFGMSEMAFMLIEIPAEMKKYVDRGGDSAWGAFYVGAKIATEAYIMEAYAAAKMLGAKAIAKGVGKGAKGMWQMTKGVTRGGMKELGKETWNVMAKEVVTGVKGWALAQTSWNKGMLENSAQEYAKKMMDNLRGNPNSRLSAAERVAQRQAMRNIENLQTITEMCNINPTKANLQLKNKIVLECQADKMTMALMKNDKLLANNRLLKGVNFQATRAKFNHVMKSIYDEVDKNMLRDLSEASKVPIEKIKIMRTSSSNGSDLLVGKTTTFDRDVTYYYVKDGKVYYFDQTLTEQLYAKNFRNTIVKRTTGSVPEIIDLSQLTPQELTRWKALEAQRGYDILKLYDQTPLEDIFGHAESYGVDVQRLVNPTLRGEDLLDPHKVAKTMMEKGQSRFNDAHKLWAKADGMPEGLARDRMYCRAIGEMREGCRQQVKVFDILCDRDRIRNVFTVVPEDLRKAVELMRTLSETPSATLSKVEEGLGKLGFTMESVTKATYELCIKIG